MSAAVFGDRSWRSSQCRIAEIQIAVNDGLSFSDLPTTSNNLLLRDADRMMMANVDADACSAVRIASNPAPTECSAEGGSLQSEARRVEDCILLLPTRKLVTYSSNVAIISCNAVQGNKAHCLRTGYWLTAANATAASGKTCCPCNPANIC